MKDVKKHYATEFCISENIQVKFKCGVVKGMWKG